MNKELTKEMLIETKWDARDWTEDMKIKWQEKMFELGFGWGVVLRKPEVRNLAYPFYYLNNDSTLGYSDCHSTDFFTGNLDYLKVYNDVFPEEEKTQSDVICELLEEAVIKVDTEVSVSPNTTGPTNSETQWTDKHYDNYYQLTEADIEAGEVKIDAYFVNMLWKLNDFDKTGAGFHGLKTYARMSNNKNTKEREIRALHGQIKRWAELEGVRLS